MPLTGNFAGLGQLRRTLDGVATVEGKGHRQLLEGVKREVKGLLKEEFSTGAGPYGAWTPRKRGGPALVSKRLSGAFAARIDRGIVRFVGKTTRDLLGALHEGHVFPARRQSAFYGASGRSLKTRRITKAGLRVKFVEERQLAVGKRVLPPRPIYPSPDLTPGWSEAIKGALTERLTSVLRAT